jgi:hypothetical protein
MHHPILPMLWMLEHLSLTLLMLMKSDLLKESLHQPVTCCLSRMYPQGHFWAKYASIHPLTLDFLSKYSKGETRDEILAGTTEGTMRSLYTQPHRGSDNEPASIMIFLKRYSNSPYSLKRDLVSASSACRAVRPVAQLQLPFSELMFMRVKHGYFVAINSIHSCLGH